MLKYYKGFILILFIGIVIRIILNNSIYSRDAYSFILWAQYLTKHSVSDLYEFLPDGYLPYPPVYYYLLMVLGKIIDWFNVWNNVWLSYFIIKLPVIFADITIATIIYSFSKKYTSKKHVLWNVGFYFLHPAIIYNTSIWGQIDSLVILGGMVWTILIIKKRYLSSLIIYLLTVFIKLQSLAILPFVSILMLLHRSKTQLLKYMVILILLSIMIFLPIIIPKGLVWSVKYFATMPNQYPYTSVYAYNFWAPLGFIQSDKDKFLYIIQYRYAGLVLYFFSSGIILIPLLKEKTIAPKILLFGAYLLFFSFAYFSTRIHSRYLIYTLGFFAPFFGRFSILGILLSILVIANLLLPESNPYVKDLVHLLNQQQSIMLFVIFGFLIYMLSLKRYFQLFSEHE